VLFIQCCSVAKSVGCFQQHLFACLWACVFINTITSERVNIGWWNLGVGALYKNLGRVWSWGYGPLGSHPINVSFGYNCLVLLMYSLSSAVLCIVNWVVDGSGWRICCCSWKPLVEYIDLRYEEYMNAEARVNRRIVPDTRVHCCLYFISPNGHGSHMHFKFIHNFSAVTSSCSVWVQCS